MPVIVSEQLGITVQQHLAGHLSLFNLQTAEHHTASLPHGMGREIGKKSKTHGLR